MKLNNETYDLTKKVVQLVLPALGVLYVTLAQIWDLPRAEEVAGTLAGIATFLGVLLGLSSKSYKDSNLDVDGIMHITDSEEKAVFRMELNDDPAGFADMESVTFRVVQD